MIVFYIRNILNFCIVNCTRILLFAAIHSYPCIHYWIRKDPKKSTDVTKTISTGRIFLAIL